LRQTFGSGPGYPSLVVLDSTHPAWVSAVTRSIDVASSLFLVSSKSGSTTETMSLYKYFHELVVNVVGEDKVGQNFVVITDPQTSLGRLADDHKFRRVFLNPPDIGGRYSVLSYFGLVPAALSGIDLNRLIAGADKMQEGCAPCVDIQENAGAWLGALIGSMALHGHNKLTFIISPSISSFGFWVEQLIAESTGKEGQGILPVAGEPLLDVQDYGDDRLFIYLRMKGDNNARTDEAVMHLELAGQPIIQFAIDEQYDLGAEFFRWEFATAIAGAVIGINPFDQPDVQSAKTATQQVLKEIQAGQGIPEIRSCESLTKWLQQSRPDNYVAIMAYFRETPASNRALEKMRQRISEKYHLATTVGYGPRFLHSTGQLHKGGPNNGLFIQLIARRKQDLKIPGEPYTLGILTEAEAYGDFQALTSKGRKVTRVQLGSGSGTEIEGLIGDLV
jgi:glucose-6-phosphate isomerase/transaldolase/glucose-6-phosphate isomerase